MERFSEYNFWKLFVTAIRVFEVEDVMSLQTSGKVIPLRKSAVHVGKIWGKFGKLGFYNKTLWL